MMRIAKDRSGGWRIIDDKGHLHSASIRSKDRAQRQADAMNAKMNAIRQANR